VALSHSRMIKIVMNILCVLRNL